MPRPPVLKPREAIRVLERAGFIFVRQKGSHRIYMKGSIGVTVPYHNGDLKPNTLRHIIKQSHLDLAQFL